MQFTTIEPVTTKNKNELSLRETECSREKAGRLHPQSPGLFLCSEKIKHLQITA